MGLHKGAKLNRPVRSFKDLQRGFRVGLSAANSLPSDPTFAGLASLSFRLASWTTSGDVPPPSRETLIAVREMALQAVTVGNSTLRIIDLLMGRIPK